MLAIALGALDATDAGGIADITWAATALAALLVAYGAAARASAPMHLGLALLGAMLLARQDSRLVLAPLYGAGLLLVAEFASRSGELREAGLVDAGAVVARGITILAVAAVGACAAAAAAAVVTAAPGRSVALTALAAVLALATFALIALHARRAYPVSRDDAEAATTRASRDR